MGLDQFDFLKNLDQIQSVSSWTNPRVIWIKLDFVASNIIVDGFRSNLDRVGSQAGFGRVRFVQLYSCLYLGLDWVSVNLTFQKDQIGLDRTNP